MCSAKNDIHLSEEQQFFIQTALEGRNILVDACIGSGKTTAIQELCNQLPDEYSILYLTYNRLLKLDAQEKIKKKNVTVTNYHGFAFSALRKAGISSNVAEVIQIFNKVHPPIPNYTVLILDEYQDIELELAEMLTFIKDSCPGMQIIAVGDMEQKIYDKTTLDVPRFINHFLGEYSKLNFTKCFRLSPALAEKLGRIWEKPIIGVNENCLVEEMNITQVIDFLASQKSQDILCLGMRNGDMADALNTLESKYPKHFNKNTVFASIREADSDSASRPKRTSSIFTTYDSSKGLERPICVIFDYTEDYWRRRITKPQQSYAILRNIFCVAASRGKQHIIFVNNKKAMLSEQTLSMPLSANTNFTDVSISQMFDFRYREDIESCYALLKAKPVVFSEDTQEINIKNTDALIDLSPCIGTYQEAVFFKQYDIDQDIDFLLQFHKNQRSQFNKNIYHEILDKKILYLTSLETKQDRYYTQVSTPFVSEVEKASLCHRLQTKFTEDETVQVACSLPFADSTGKNLLFTAYGRADVVKEHIIYELKFVSELAHEHFLQCACYMLAMDLDVGILWNTRKNHAYEIRIPDRNALLDAIAKTVTKGFLQGYTPPSKTVASDFCVQESAFAVIDTETNFQNEVMSIGAVIADATTLQALDSRYYILTPACSVGGMYAAALPLAEAHYCSRSAAVADLQKFFAINGVFSIYAYNAVFDRNHLPELAAFTWFDIMKVAAYRQYNYTIDRNANCTANGKLKSGYGVEPTLRRLLKTPEYCESHNALHDAYDELKIMELLGHPLQLYQKIACINAKKIAVRPHTTIQEFNSSLPSGTMDKEPVPSEALCWTITDLIHRYNVSRYHITNTLIKYGLPYAKHGARYCFPIDEVKQWELKVKKIPYDRAQKTLILPAYLEYRTFLLTELSKAKKAKNHARIKELKTLARQSKISLQDFPDWLVICGTLSIFALILYWFFWHWHSCYS